MNRKFLLIITLLVFGLFIRLFLVNKVVVGDLLAYGEWGEKIWQYGARNFYFGKIDWQITAPVYYPLSNILFGSLNWIYEHKYWLAQLHNVIKIPPAIFNIYFYKWGYILLLKLPSVIADLGISLLIFKFLMILTKDFRKAVIGMSLYLFNPITIFISGAWGQTDALVGFLGLSSFYLLSKKKLALSIPLLFVSLYFKLSWAIFVPFYLFIIYLIKPRFKDLIIGVIISVGIFIISTIPFSGTNIIDFVIKLTGERILIPVGTVGRASNSAFNFITIFFKIDRDFSNVKLLFIPINIIGYILVILLNIKIFIYTFKNKKYLLKSIIIGLFFLGMGSFLFMTNMLERYFFPSFAPMMILMILYSRVLLSGIVINIILAANILWSFYRRGSDEIDHPFTQNNFLLIKILSFALVVEFIYLKKLLMGILSTKK